MDQAITIEQAARNLCRLRGIDPDTTVPGVLLCAATEVSDFLQLQAACEHAQAKPSALPFPDSTPP